MLTRLVLTVVIVSAPAVAAAQDWIEYASRDDFFTANFPGQPRITEGAWTTEYGAALKARVYSAEQGRSKYQVMAIDYTPVEGLLTERSKSCPAGAEPCRGVTDTGVGYWKNDVRGAVTYATWKLMERPGTKVTHLMWNFVEMVAGHQLQLTNADGSRTFASIYMHRNKLIIMEGTVPAEYPEPGLFQQSLGWIDETGRGIRYQTIYVEAPDITKPSVRPRPAANVDQGRINAPGAK